jgi:uncharacterized repeat protein (TIGR02543 family)
MKKYLAIIMAAAILCLTVCGALPVAADTAAPAFTSVSVYSTVALMVNGIQSTQSPITCGVGDTVSIINKENYISEGERYTFQGWSNGQKATVTTITIDGSVGVITANWSHDILVQVTSQITSLLSSTWEPYGIPVDLKAPATVTDGDTIQYLFQQWSDGETPYKTTNTIVPLSPMTVTATYQKQDLLTIVAPDGITIPGSGWYNDGASIVIQAPQDVYDTAKTSRLDFNTWESTGATIAILSSPTTAQLSLTVSGPYILQAEYNQQYNVVATTPFGSLNNDWVTSGATEQLNAPAAQAVVTGAEQYVFKDWTGMAGLVSPAVGGTVTGPLKLSAEYSHQYMLTLTAPYGGSGGGWTNAGTVVTVTVPASSQKNLFMTARFTGFAGYSGKSTSLQVLVNGPVTVTANYVTGLDLRVLLILIGALLAAIILYGLVRRLKLWAWFK